MPPKQKLMAPVDRPLSRAYLREFTGWSTAYPPGLSDPTSLRIMENIQINRDGSARVRPGLRYLSFFETDPAPGSAILNAPVGTHEVFFLNDGSKAYLFAVRENDGTVGFRVLAQTPYGRVVQPLTASGIDFEIPQGEATLNFTAGTTYVKYLQIDNKIFALSNNGEPMRRFEVGASKTAKTMSSISQPDWNVADKLTALEPDAVWINNGVPIETRTNLFSNPRMETNLNNVNSANLQTTGVSRTTAFARSGVFSAEVRSLPTRENICPYPITNGSIAGWAAGSDSTISVVGGNMRVGASHAHVQRIYANGPLCVVTPGQTYTVAGQFANLQDAESYGWMVRFYNGAMGQIGGDNFLTWSSGPGRLAWNIAAPAGAVYMQPFATARNPDPSDLLSSPRMDVWNVLICKAGEDWATMFDGNSGANYGWSGTPYASPSYYHPPVDVFVNLDMSGDPGVVGGQHYWAVVHARAGSTARNIESKIWWYDPTTFISSSAGSTVADAAGSWTAIDEDADAPAGATRAIVQLKIPAVPRNEVHYLDDIIFERRAAVDGIPPFFSGADASSPTVQHTWAGAADGSRSTKTTYSVGTSIPAAETATANTLISNDPTKNVYNFGFFYTFSNEVGESAASQVTIVRTQRPWAGWRWELANASGEPNGTATTDPALAADQLVAFMPQAVYDQAVAEGAISWNLYMFTWSDQAPVPSTAVRVGSKDISSPPAYGTDGWQRVTPVVLDQTDDFAALPTIVNRYNYSDPSKGGQGIVAADRMVLVYDPTSAAVIRWSANQQGDYSNFTAAKGGGYKTLTSGNLYIPATVKLWQNPQSVDTLTILCMGVDGMSTSYYMAPAEVTGQSEATSIMGFEETTATPGTTSPYGVEVFNNALYHPLDEMLMKSTANNYNISHKEQTELIRDGWERLQNKHRIVSSQYDGRLYFIVHNPLGAVLENGCMGNEIWVMDVGGENPTWSRWLIQAHSLRKIEVGGKVFMSVVRPDGIFYLDPEYDRDDVVPELGAEITTRFIPWKLETNTQGANRAHDAWSHLQQANVTFGNFLGECRYGIRGYDVNGKPVDINKLYISPIDPATSLNDNAPFDQDDFLLIRKQMKEWHFYAESVAEGDVVQSSFGQISLVQYRYAPISVNVGYEYGSVETFEYGLAGNVPEQRTSVNGVPQPYIDTRRP